MCKIPSSSTQTLQVWPLSCSPARFSLCLIPDQVTFFSGKKKTNKKHKRRNVVHPQLNILQALTKRPVQMMPEQTHTYLIQLCKQDSVASSVNSSFYQEKEKMLSKKHLLDKTLAYKTKLVHLNHFTHKFKGLSLLILTCCQSKGLG